MDQLASLSLARGVRIANVDFSDDAVIATVILHVQMLASRGLTSIDVIVGGPGRLQAGLTNIIKLARAVPNSFFILDHIGNPPYFDSVLVEGWQIAITSIGAERNIICKVGGILQGYKSTMQMPSVDEIRFVLHPSSLFLALT